MLDNTIWKNIGSKKFCSFKKKTETEFLCKNKNNLTGMCNEFSCPLANTKYATVRAIGEELYLCIKEPERINTPKDQYEKIKLSNNYIEAVKQIDTELEYWDKQIIHKCKQKHTKLVEYIDRLEHFKQYGRTEYIKKTKKKVTRAEKLAALANLESLDFEKQIGDEILLRLESGVYGDTAKDKYQKAHEQHVEDKNKAKKKKVYVAHYESEDSTVSQYDEQNKTEKECSLQSDKNVNIGTERLENDYNEEKKRKHKKKAKKKTEKLTW